MPYKRRSREIYVKKSGQWKRKQTCTTINKAKAALRLLKEKTGH